MSAVSRSTGAESYFAQPYSLSAVGFYFTDLAEYEARAANAADDYGQHVEEFEIQYIDGEYAQLFAAVGVNQANLADWFDLLDELDGDDNRVLIACHLAGLSYPLGEIAAKCDDYSVYRGTAAEYAEEVTADCYRVPTDLQPYIDYERMGRDMVLGGDVTEVERDVLIIG